MTWSLSGGLLRSRWCWTGVKWNTVCREKEEKIMEEERWKRRIIKEVYKRKDESLTIDDGVRIEDELWGRRKVREERVGKKDGEGRVESWRRMGEGEGGRGRMKEDLYRRRKSGGEKNGGGKMEWKS
ncbi:hypothetical protein ElyMa_005778800 [Elysia marginata]|uniref:Uncharacterized protein n=1 Tax=Elysia marginata TaxID=1093978 RepID=A0AAV4FPZ4_9GAST|nr:hypothetical protein ElyMa_005778800 [Elysia marginata]